MASRRSLDFTYQGHLQHAYYASEYADESEIRRMLSQFKRFGAARLHAPLVFYAIDYTRSGYLVMTDGSRMITSYDARDFLEGGIPHLIDVYQKDDFRIYNEKVFPANVRCLKAHPYETHRRFIFSYNFRVRHRDGHYVSILQRGGYITSKETGLPLYSLGMITDITPFKRDALIYHTIETWEGSNDLLANQLIESNYFFPNEEDRLLSRQERCILGYMTEGWSTKQIAWKLHLSENTVANHRKNMLKKTNTKNVAELVAFACRSGLI